MPASKHDELVVLYRRLQAVEKPLIAAVHKAEQLGKTGMLGIEIAGAILALHPVLSLAMGVLWNEISPDAFENGAASQADKDPGNPF